MLKLRCSPWAPHGFIFMKMTEKCNFGNMQRTSNKRLEKVGGDGGVSIFSVCFSYNLWENADSWQAPRENSRSCTPECGEALASTRDPWWAGLQEKVVTVAAKLHGTRSQRTTSGNRLCTPLQPFLQKWRWGNLVNHRWGGNSEGSLHTVSSASPNEDQTPRNIRKLGRGGSEKRSWLASNHHRLSRAPWPGCVFWDSQGKRWH